MPPTTIDRERATARPKDTTPTDSDALTGLTALVIGVLFFLIGAGLALLLRWSLS